MLKQEKLTKILEIVNSKGTITVKQIMDEIAVSDMTARRYLQELADKDLLIRVHGGAEKLRTNSLLTNERSNIEKQALQTAEKQEIARFAGSLVEERETIFIGPGTTLEFFARELPIDNIRVVTNSLPVFLILSERKLTDLILIGGNYREITGAFVGTLTLQNLSNLQFSKAFVSCNGIQNGALATFSEEEGEAQRIALTNSNKKYLLADNSKFNKFDFYTFYNVSNLDTIVSDSKLSDSILFELSKLTKVIKP
ncbi:DeoR/GlpR family DNA-binding transcription regulator [Streptococcus sp. 596553]|uniref:DeoR/GlpR family DNA-binding transcription regulator n=1 Tax=Streptococcus sp. 596553 TaxID=2250596 RepID=UPI000DD50BC6|nr:DeoR/GlpR family DNA-binding transcription regulator [Streptococcus sp. 596553]